MKSYKYRYGGKKGALYELVEAKDLIVVRTEDVVLDRY